MKTAKWLMIDKTACGPVRGVWPSVHINSKSPLWRVDCKDSFNAADQFGTHAVVIQCGRTEGALRYMQAFQAQGIATIYDIDDNWLALPEGCDVLPQLATKENKVLVKQMIEMADLVTCSTRVLAEDLRKLARIPRMHVVQNCLDMSVWTPSARTRTDDGIVIGWVASHLHKYDAPLVKQALTGILADFPQVRVELCGVLEASDIVEPEQEHRVNVHEWVPYSTLQTTMANFDIGLSPLQDSVMNRGRSDLKWLQYSALGVPSVVSGTPTHADVSDGVDTLVAMDNSPEGWYKALHVLVSNAGLRNQIGRNALTRVRAERDLNTTWTWMAEAFDMAVARRHESWQH